MPNNIKKIFPDLVLLSICFFASGLFSIYLEQTRNWDLRNYHYYIAYSFLNNRLTYDIAPAQIQSFFNPILDIPFYLMIRYLKPIFCGFLVGGLQGINIWLIYKLAYLILVPISKIQRFFLSFAAGLTGYFGAANLSEIGTTFHDNITSLLILAGIALIVTSILQSENQKVSISKKMLVVSAFLLGCATGLKLTVAIYALAFVFSLLLIGSNWKNRVENIIISSLSVFFGTITTLGCWMAILWKNFNSPLFPFYNAIFKSPYYEFKNFIDARFFPRDMYQTVFYPFYFAKHQKLVSEEGFRDIRLAVCYILFVLLIFILYYKWVNRRYGHQESLSSFEITNNLKSIYTYIIFFFVSSYILWQSTFSIYRYLIPLELLSPVFIILIIRYIFPFNKIFFPLSLITFALIIVTVVPMNWGRVSWGQDYFDVRIPKIENLADSTIIMAGYDPLAYIIPFFPERTRFVRVQSNFVRPDSNTRLQVKIRKLLKNSNTLYILYKENRQHKKKVDYNSILKFYNLKITEQNYIKLSTRFDDDLFLFPVSQLN